MTNDIINTININNKILPKIVNINVYENKEIVIKDQIGIKINIILYIIVVHLDTLNSVPSNTIVNLLKNIINKIKD